MTEKRNGDRDKFAPKFRVYEKDNLLKLSEDKSKPIVQDFLYENDYAMLMAPPKIGKSILTLQLACALSSGENFLNILEVTKPVRVWYFSTEGKDEDTKHRLVRMSHKVKINVDYLKLICCSGIQFNTAVGREALARLYERYKSELPKVIIIDALYAAIKGSMTVDEIWTDFTATIRSFAEACDAAVIIVHHAKRPFKLKDGTTKDSGDDEIYGSAFLKASVDHLFYMGVIPHTDHFFLKCDTQRSGNIIDTVELIRHVPDPLYWELTEYHESALLSTKALLEEWKNKGGISVTDMAKKEGIRIATIYSALT